MFEKTKLKAQEAVIQFTVFFALFAENTQARMNLYKMFTKWLLLPLLILAGMITLPAALTPLLGPTLGQYTSYAITFLIALGGLFVYRKGIKKSDRE